MTPPGSPAPATPPTTPVTRLRNPGELLAALPYLIGFHPRDSLLFIAFGGSSGRRIELTQRVDLPPADDAPAVCRALAANVVRVTPAGVAVVVVGGDPVVAGGVPFGGPPPANHLAGVAEEALVACGVTVQSRTWAAGTGAGAAWACYDTCGCRGAVPDPDSTPFAATAVAPGLVAPAVLLAACALLRGDGALAGIALDRAEQAWPGHRLTRLLRAVWAAGIPPERVRECLSAPEPPAMPVTRVAGRRRPAR